MWVVATYWTLAATTAASMLIAARSKKGLDAIFARHGAPRSRGMFAGTVVLLGLLWPLVLAIDIVDALRGSDD